MVSQQQVNNTFAELAIVADKISDKFMVYVYIKRACAGLSEILAAEQRTAGVLVPVNKTIPAGEP